MNIDTNNKFVNRKLEKGGGPCHERLCNRVEVEGFCVFRNGLISISD